MREIKVQQHLGMSKLGFLERPRNSKDLLSMTVKKCCRFCWKQCTKISTVWLRNLIFYSKTLMVDRTV